MLTLSSEIKSKTSILILLIVSLCGCSQHRTRNEVIVLGMIHGGHRTSEVYGIEQIKDLVRRIEPDYILCEIPPGRLKPALREYRETGKITEPRVRVFPEYVDAIIPMMSELKFELVPCAGWTRKMADDRRAKLEQYKTTRPADHQEMRQAMDEADRQIEQAGLAEDPRKIHTPQYDAIVKRGMEPYNRLFNDDLGPGGWDNINAAHYRLIAKALNEHRHDGRRFLITFGSWHKYWFLEKLRQRPEIRLRNVSEFLAPAFENSSPAKPG